MKAMLLAAGLGERMQPLSRVVPKPALPVLGRPLASMVLHRLAAEGISEAVVNLHHRAEQVRAVLGDGHELGLTALHYTYEPKILGTGGGIKNAADFLSGGERILVRNSDFLADIDLMDVTATHLASDCPVTLVLAPHRPGYTPVLVSHDRVLSFGGKPPADPAEVTGQYMFTGLQLMDVEVLERIPADRPSDLVRDVYMRLAAEREIAYHVHSGFWWEFGTPADYLEGSLELILMDPSDRGRIAKTDPVERVGDALVAVGTGADFHNGVALRGCVALGFACLVAEGSTLEDTIVMPEAWVGPGVTLRRSIVAPGVEVPAGFEGEGVLVCPDTEPDTALPADTERISGLLVRRIGARRPMRV